MLGAGTVLQRANALGGSSMGAGSLCPTGVSAHTGPFVAPVAAVADPVVDLGGCEPLAAMALVEAVELSPVKEMSTRRRAGLILSVGTVAVVVVNPGRWNSGGGAIRAASETVRFVSVHLGQRYAPRRRI